MKLKRVIIKNYKNLKDVEINFPDSNIIAFIGNNGSGKSNILENIAHTFFVAKDFNNRNDIDYIFDYIYQIDSNEYRIEDDGVRFLFYKNKARDIKNIGNGLPKVIFTYYAGETGRLNSYSEYFQKSYDEYLKLKRDDNIDLKFVTSFSLKDFPIAFFANYVFQTSILDKIKDLLGFSSVEEHRILMQFKKPYWSSADGTGENVWGARGFNKFFFDKLLEEDEEYGVGPFIEFDSGEDYITLTVGCSDLFRNLAETPLELYTKLKAMLDSGFLETIRIFVRKDGEMFPIELFSEGEKQLANLLMLMDLTKEFKALFLLDEFDAYLHPNWQREFIKLISEINIRGQVLLTTHSPLTLNKINKENIRILKDGEIYSLTVDSFNRDVVQILEEIMEVPKRPKEVEDAIKHFRNAVMHNQKDEANKAIENLKRLLNKDDPFWVTIEHMMAHFR